MKDFPINNAKSESIVVICGTGNNGGDGMCIARWLIHKGYKVAVILLGSEEKYSEDTKIQYKLLKKIIEFYPLASMESYKEQGLSRRLEQATLVIDAMIGTGCSRTLSDTYLQIVQNVNTASCFVYAVDVPTGINSDNGKEMGCAIKADVTITFCLPKLGLVVFPGCNYVGRLIIADIGVLEEALTVVSRPIELLDKTTLNAYNKVGRLHRPSMSHKGTFGTVGIVAGDRHMLGATLLSAKGAYKTGAGLVKIFAPEEYTELFIATIPECVIVTYDKDLSKEGFDVELEKFVLSCTSIVIGPGLSTSLKARHMVQKILQLDTKVVFDADALNIISEHMEWFEHRFCQCIITPHIGEMARLTGYPSSGISENTIQFAEAFGEKYSVTTVLKSARTVIVSKDGQRFINMLGNSGMATAGSGDVLSGVIGGLIAMGYSMTDGSKLGVLLHSLAGDVGAFNGSQHALMATDIIHNLWKGFEE